MARRDHQIKFVQSKTFDRQRAKRQKMAVQSPRPRNAIEKRGLNGMRLNGLPYRAFLIEERKDGSPWKHLAKGAQDPFATPIREEPIVNDGAFQWGLTGFTSLHVEGKGRKREYKICGLVPDFVMFVST